MDDFLGRFWRFLGSFGLATVLVVLLAVLTFWGTLEQTRSNIYYVQENYFRSVYVIHYIDGKYPLPLPGGYLLMGLLFVNLIVGGIIRMRKDKRRIGVFIVHLGIALLLLGGFIEDMLSTKGNLQVSEAGYRPPPGERNPPQTDDVFTSTEDWEVVIARDDAGGAKTLFSIPQSEFEGLSGDDTLRATHPDLPFDLVLRDYAKNATLKRLPADRAGEGVDGLELVKLEPASGQNTIDVPGLHGRIVEKTTGTVHEILLSGLHRDLIRFSLGGQGWTIDLRRRSWQLPFKIRLQKFVVEFHPGTMMPREYSSYVDVLDDRDGGPASRRAHITMNEPLRDGLYTLYQTNWGPQPRPGRSPATHYYSVLAVVKSPSDAWSMWPIWSCVVIAVGLLIHFVWKLVLYLKAEARKRAPAAGSC